MDIYHFKYKEEFKNPQLGINFHWWDQNKTSLHTHDYYEIFLVTKGEIMHSLNGKKEVISEKTLFFIHPSDVHQFLPINDKPAQHINFSLTQYLLESLCSVIEPDIYHKIINGKLCNKIILKDSTYNEFISSISNMNTLKNETEQTILMKQFVINILSLLYTATYNDTNYPDWLEKLIATIRSEKFLSCCVRDIYKLSNYSQPMLLHYFKKYTGETLVSYFTKIKMNYASNLLVNTNFTILYISNTVGYSSLSHFIRIFKKYTGKSPKEYRQTYHK